MGRCAGDAQDDAITARTAHDCSHPVSVDMKDPDRSRRSAAGALGASGCQIRKEQLAQDSCRRVAIDPMCVGTRFSCSTLFHGDLLSAPKIVVNARPIRQSGRIAPS